MRTNYRFSINSRPVSPIYDDKLSKEYELEGDEQFYRAKLSGKVKFIGKDYLWLYNVSYEIKLVLLVEISHNGVDFETYFTGSFFRNDCEWNNDDKIVIAKVEPEDEYTTILSGYGKEYNLIKLNPVKEFVEIQKRPLVQLYVPGDSVVSCILGGMYWEQDVNQEVTDHNDLINKYYFKVASKFNKVSITDDGYFEKFAGDYISKGAFDAKKLIQTFNSDNKYRVDYYPSGSSYTLYLYDNLTNSILYTSNSISNKTSPINTEHTLYGVGVESGKELKLFWFDMKIYTRYLLDSDYIKFMITSIATFPIPSDDFINDNRNYKRAVGYSVDVITVNNKTQEEPTEYGLSDNNKYFIKPDNSVNSLFFPIARSTWTMSSIWYNYSSVNYAYEIGGQKSLVLKDASPLYSIIKVLLNEVAPDILHEETEEYSMFFYGSENPISFAKFRIFLTQKSNMISGEYDKPAQKANITLQDVLVMLRDTFRCYWFIDNNKLRIEHISFFIKGLSYKKNNDLLLDLTTEVYRKNKKLYSLYTDKFSYDKTTLSERLEFKWMDEVTSGFAGYPIEMVSNHVQLGKIDSINPGSFTSDVDYMLINPNVISKDGFALLGVVDNNPVEPMQESENGYYNHTTGLFVADDLYKSQMYDIYKNQWVIEELSDLYYTGISYDNACITYYDTNKNFLGYEFKALLAIALPFTRKKLTIPESTRFIGTSSYGPHYADLTFFAKYKLPFSIEYADGNEYRLQNGYVSWIYLHRWFWKHNLPTKQVKINNSSTVALSILNSKKQTISYPSKDDIYTFGIIKTGLGNGKIDSMKVNLSSRMHEIKLKYETEQ